MELNVMALLGGAAGIGLVTAFWNNIKRYLYQLFSLVFVTSKIADSNLIKSCCLIYLVKNYKRLNIQDRFFCGFNEFVRTNRRSELIAVEIPNSSIWYKRGEIINVNLNTGDLEITYLRWTFDIESFIKNALEYNNATTKNTDWKKGMDRYRIIKQSGSIGDSSKNDKNYGKGNNSGYGEISKPTDAPVAHSSNGWDTILYNTELRYEACKPLKYTKDQLGQPKRESPIAMLSLKQNVLDAVEEALKWRSSEEWFKNRSIPWKRGFVLYSPPGCGKTAFVRALGQELNMPITVFDLSTMTNQDFTEAWSNMVSRTPCIALIEDIDGVFENRKNIAVQGLNQGLSFDCLLNTIDGVENTDGVFLIITTNNIEKLDSALGNPMPNGEGKESMSTRPGRIDRAIKFDILDREGRIKMANRIFEGIDESKWKHILESGEKDTGAQFQERCCRLALKLFWENK